MNFTSWNQKNLKCSLPNVKTAMLIPIISSLVVLCHTHGTVCIGERKLYVAVNILVKILLLLITYRCCPISLLTILGIFLVLLDFLWHVCSVLQSGTYEILKFL